MIIPKREEEREERVDQGQRRLVSGYGNIVAGWPLSEDKVIELWKT